MPEDRDSSGEHLPRRYGEKRICHHECSEGSADSGVADRSAQVPRLVQNERIIGNDGTGDFGLSAFMCEDLREGIS